MDRSEKLKQLIQEWMKEDEHVYSELFELSYEVNMLRDEIKSLKALLSPLQVTKQLEDTSIRIISILNKFENFEQIIKKNEVAINEMRGAITILRSKMRY